MENTYKLQLQRNAPTIVRQAVNYRSIEVHIHYNDTIDGWIVDFFETTNKGLVPIITGLALVPPLNLLEGRQYLGLGEFYMIPTNIKDGVYSEPSANNLSSAFNLIWSW